MTTPFFAPEPGHNRDSDQIRASETKADSDDTDPIRTDNPAASPAESFFAPNTDAAPSASALRLRPRFGTILWGILLLAFAAYMVVFTLLPVPPDPTLWLLGGVIAVGLGLVVAGIAASARRVD